MDEENTQMPPELDHLSEWFWDIVGRANKSPETLEGILRNMSKEEVRRFQEEFVDASADLRVEPFTTHMIKGSEDSVEDVAHWVVSQGRDYFLRIWNNPEQIPFSVEEGDPSMLYSVAPRIYRERFGETLDVY
jgi:hypothetical protein